jgi:hypothetical protein
MAGGKDKRGAPRRRTHLRSGQVLNAGGALVANCLMRDLSVTGARLKLLVDAILPIDIRYLDENTSTVRDAKVVWRKGPEIGIRFTSSARPVGAPPQKGPEVRVMEVYR